MTAKRATAISLLIAGLISSIQIISVAQFWDFQVDHGLARSVVDGIMPYDENGFEASGLKRIGVTGLGHPPSTIFYFLPFAFFSLETAYLIFSVMMLSALAWCVKICLDLTETFSYNRWLAICGLLQICPFMRLHLNLGQLSVFICLLLLLAMQCFKNNKAINSGIFWGMACSIKFFPGFLLVFFVRNFKARLFLMAGSVFIGNVLFMSMIWPWSAWELFFCRQAPIAEAWLGNITNHSVHGVVLRSYFPSWISKAVPISESIILSTIISIILWILYAICCRKWITAQTFHENRTGGIVYMGALGLLLSPFASQWAWPHYQIFYLLPMIILARDSFLDSLNVKQFLNLERGKVLRIFEMSSVGLLLMSMFLPLSLAGTFQRQIFDGEDQYWTLASMVILENITWVAIVFSSLSLVYRCLLEERHYKNI